MRRVLLLILMSTLALGSAIRAEAITGGTELYLPAAARGPGAGGSFWVTDLYIRNNSPFTTIVTLEWLVRDQPNVTPPSVFFRIEIGETLVLPDVVKEVFGLEIAGGAIRLRSEVEIAADARIYNRKEVDGGAVETFGQGFEAIPVEHSQLAGSASEALGGADLGFRTNAYGVSTSSGITRVRVLVVDADGSVLGSDQIQLNSYQPFLFSINDFGNFFRTYVTVRFEVIEGSGIFGISTVDQETGDPTTHTTWRSRRKVGGDGWYVGRTAFEAAGTLIFEVVNGQVVSIGGEQTLLDGDGNMDQCSATISRWVFPVLTLAFSVDDRLVGEVLFEDPDDPNHVFILQVVGDRADERIEGVVRLRSLFWDGCSGTTDAYGFFLAWTEADPCDSLVGSHYCENRPAPRGRQAF